MKIDDADGGEFSPTTCEYPHSPPPTPIFFSCFLFILLFFSHRNPFVAIQAFAHRKNKKNGEMRVDMPPLIFSGTPFFKKPTLETKKKERKTPK